MHRGEVYQRNGEREEPVQRERVDVVFDQITAYGIGEVRDFVRRAGESKGVWVNREYQLGQLVSSLFHRETADA